MGKIIKYQQGAKTPFNAQNETTLTGPTIRGKRYPAGTIVTNDPKLYERNQDSLQLYNYYNLQKKLSEFVRVTNFPTNSIPEDELRMKHPKEWLINYMRNQMEIERKALAKEEKSLKEHRMTDDMKESFNKIINVRKKHLNNPYLYVKNFIPLWTMGDKLINENDNFQWINAQDSPDLGHKRIKPIYAYWSEIDHAVNYAYKKPVDMVMQNGVLQNQITPMTPKGLPVFTQPTPKLLRMPDRIELDPTKHAAYRGIDVNHYTDALGRYTAKLNLVTKPGVTGRISYKRGGMLNKTRKHKEYKNQDQ